MELICPDCGEILVRVEFRYADIKRKPYLVWICGCSNIPDREKLTQQFKPIEKQTSVTIIKESENGEVS
jgi:hypothetical protein